MHQQANAVADFSQYAKCLMLARGNLQQAAAMKEASGVSPRVMTVLKSAVASGTTTDSAWAAPLVDYQTIAGNFVESLVGVSAFDTIAAASWNTPLGTRIGATVNAAVGSIVGETAPNPVTKMGFTAIKLAPRLVLALCAITEELVRSPFAEQFIQDELRLAVATASDLAFVSTISTGASTSVTAGTGADNALKDIRTLLDKVNAAGALPYLILSATNANALSVADGTPFRECTPTGGKVAGVPYIVSAAPGTSVVAVDARALLTGSEAVTLDGSKNATLQLDSAPANPTTASTVMVSLWQQNLMGLLAKRNIGFEIIRAAGVAVITGAAW